MKLGFRQRDIEENHGRMTNSKVSKFHQDLIEKYVLLPILYTFADEITIGRLS